MGAFINNLQVRVPDESSRARLTDAIRRYAADHQLFKVEATDADRTFVIVGGAASPWVTVIDEAFDSQDPRVLAEVASALSAKFDGQCVTILVHDGDTLDLELYARGKRIDRHHTSFGDSKRKTGTAKKWAHLLVPPAAPSDLAVLWRTPALGEDVLDQTAVMFGWDPTLVALSFRYLDELDPAPAQQRLHFRDPNPPPYRRRESGPPAFETPHISTTVGFDLAPGEETQETISFSLTPAGGSGTGFLLALIGDGVPLLELERASITPCDERLHAVYWAAPFEKIEGGATPMSVARFPEVHIPAAVSPLRPDDPESTFLKWMDAQERTRLFVQVYGRGAANGTGKLGVVVRPLESREGVGYAETEINVGTPRRPLTAGDVHESALRAITRPFTLIGHAVLREPDVQAITQAVTAWNHVLTETVERAVWLGDIDRKKRYGATSDELTSSPSWKVVMSAPKKVQRYFLTLFAQGEDESPSDTIAERDYDSQYARGGFAMINGAREDATQIVLWKRIRGADEAETAALEAQLANIIDDLASATGALQGYIARWQMFTPYATMYEAACGAGDDPDLLSVARAAKTLRGVSERIWLGRELVDRLDRSSVEEVAVVSDRPSGIRITLKHSATLDDLERAVEPVLPRS